MEGPPDVIRSAGQGEAVVCPHACSKQARRPSHRAGLAEDGGALSAHPPRFWGLSTVNSTELGVQVSCAK